MRAMILAAGRGSRMGKLTRTTPKPLLKIGDHHLIEYPIFNLKRAGIDEIIINVRYQSDKICATLGNGNQYGVNIIYSVEQNSFDTGGGILNALSLLGSDPFIVLSADIITDYPLTHLSIPDGLAHLVLVDNPSFHPRGDFGLNQNKVNMLAKPRKTFANIGIYRPELFTYSKSTNFPLSDLLFPAIEKSLISGEYYQGIWYNVGTQEALASLNANAPGDPSSLRSSG